MNIVTFILAVIGSLGTIIQGTRAFIASRVNMRFEIVDYTRINNATQFFIEIQNLSTVPICISSISIVDGDSTCKCELLSKKICQTGGILYRTPVFPLNIPPKTGRLFFIEFLDAPQILLGSGHMLHLSFDTNRGILKRDLSLSDPSRYLHTQ